ncbi:MAG: hypothetical protein RSD36_16520 [Terrisporobacter sp.]
MFFDEKSFRNLQSLKIFNLSSVFSSCFGWGVYRLWGGHIAYRTTTLFLQLSSRLSGPFSSLINLVPSVIWSTTADGRIMEVLELSR